MDQFGNSIETIVLQVLGELGFRQPEPLGQTLLLRGGHLVGRRFRFAGIEALWFADEGQIKFRDDQGKLLRVLEIGDRWNKMAA